MLGEFVHKSRVYCIKSIIDPKTPDEHEIKFNSLKDAKNFFAHVASDSFSREELLDIAKWLRPASCRTPSKCPEPTAQELLDMLCLYIYENGLKGDYRLVELKPPEPTLKFEACCVESMKRIGIIIDNTNLSAIILCIAQVHSIMASHKRLPGAISALSSAYNAQDSDWKKLADGMLSLSETNRTAIRKIAELEYFEHYEAQNNRKLGKYWKRIYDAANE